MRASCNVIALILFYVSIAVSQPAPPIPTLPRSFSTDYSVAINIFNGNYPLFEGHFAVDYDGLGGMIYFEDSPQGGVPYVLQTSVIGHPLASLGQSLGYEYLSEGRCWVIGHLDKQYFHYVPLAIPPNALFLGNDTINGDAVSTWSWQAEVDGFFSLSFILMVRYADNAPLVFVIDNTFFLSFSITIRNSRFFLNPAKDYFNTPPGPCANKSWNFASPSPATAESKVSGFSGLKKFFSKLFGYQKTGFLSLKRKETVSQTRMSTNKVFPKHIPVITKVIPGPDPPVPPPSPPTLHQYFQADYEIGYGNLNETNGWKPPNSLFRGNMAVDKDSGGFYVNINDNQLDDVPYMFSTNIAITPGANSTDLTGYWFLHPGRCWKLEDNIVNPDFPLQIPSDATFVGYKTVYGTPASVWQFNGYVEGYSGEVQMAVSSKDNSILFITIDPDYEDLDLGTYLIFTNFNTSKPDPATYAPPPGHCWDPLHGGPGGK